MSFLLACLPSLAIEELSHEQSREIQQYHARRHEEQQQQQQQPHQYLLGTTRAAVRQAWQERGRFAVASMGHLLEQTVEEMSRFTSIFRQAARDAWQEQYQRGQQRHYHHHHASHGGAYAYQGQGSILDNHHHHHHHRMDLNTRGGDHNDNSNDPATYLDEFGIPNEDGSAYSPIQEEIRQENDFIFLPRLRNRTPAQEWGAVADLDIYFTSLYTYYYHRGLLPIISKGIVQLVTLFFTLFLSVFLFAHVDWKELSTCIDESTCHADFFESYVHKRPFSKFTLWTVIVILYCFIFTAYGLFSIWSFLTSLNQALNAKWVFEERLGISAHKLQGGAIDWDRHVVSRLMELQRSGDYRVAIHGQGRDFDALVVAQRILRKENFMVALFNKGLIDLSVPVLGKSFFCSSIEVSCSREQIGELCLPSYPLSC